MLLTESAAREKWCPFARVVVEGEGDKIAAANRLPGSGGRDDPDMEWPSPRCIASGCMAWRWDDTAQGQRRSERQGFCGLAGDPVIITGVSL